MIINKIEKSIKNLLEALGENPSREGLIETPMRVAKSYLTLCEGYTQNPRDLMTTFDSEEYKEVIYVKNIEFYSLCEHHLLPFFGNVHISYIPDKKIIGLSKLPRLVDLYARRLQNQERLTKQIMEAISFYLKPLGVAVIIEARHLCVQMRGVQKQNCTVTTSSFYGSLSGDTDGKKKFLDYLHIHETQTTPIKY